MLGLDMSVLISRELISNELWKYCSSLVSCIINRATMSSNLEGSVLVMIEIINESYSGLNPARTCNIWSSSETIWLVEAMMFIYNAFEFEKILNYSGFAFIFYSLKLNFMLHNPCFALRCEESF